MSKMQRKRELAVAAARKVAPIANWVKPSKAPITLPEIGVSPHQRIAELEAELARERAEKFQIQNAVSSLSRRLNQAHERISAFAKDEQ